MAKIIEDNVVSGILEYLLKRPCGEVMGAVQTLMNLPPYEAPAEKPNKTKNVK